ncbi:hypothetical protein EQI52_06155 [Leuconostoc mesenteroides]|uniref:YopX family protein n=1 Tax=Leuconostoc mesenteroides TaxID=1245 RepID=UPI000FFCC9AE|nr:YopX family protein [Leuconostoc mesenteroides]QAR69392.1 hypothetical protein EQI52_06155 [Leuconostoc mesenteroides]WJM73878.1 YopX family protein [Leuconostoc mesenteroides]
MSREIKFRAWDKDEKQYIDVSRFDISPYDGAVVDLGGYEYHEAVLEQYTGIKDFNGVDIYQNDIVQPIQSYQGVPNMKPSKRGLPMVVKSGDYVYGKWIAKEVQTSGFGVCDYHFSEELQVIGNIHKNPELLEE